MDTTQAQGVLVNLAGLLYASFGFSLVCFLNYNEVLVLIAHHTERHLSSI